MIHISYAGRTQPLQLSINSWDVHRRPLAWQHMTVYSKCPKILHTKFLTKLAYVNSADPVQTASEAVWFGSILFAIPLSIFRKKKLHEKQNLGQKVWNKVFKILGQLPYYNETYHVSR